MRKLFAALTLLVLATGCGRTVLPTQQARAEYVDECSAARSVRLVLIGIHRGHVDQAAAFKRFDTARRELDNEANGPKSGPFRDMAAAVRVWEIVKRNGGDISDARRDLDALRTELPRCPKPAVVPRTMLSATSTSAG